MLWLKNGDSIMLSSLILGMYSTLLPLICDHVTLQANTGNIKMMPSSEGNKMNIIERDWLNDIISAYLLIGLFTCSEATTIQTCRSQAKSVAPLAFDTTVICWKVSKSWTWILFSEKKKKEAEHWQQYKNAK